MARKRNRSRGTGGTTSSLLRNLAIAVVVIAMASLVVQSAAFDALQGTRDTNIGSGSDDNALVGIDLPDHVEVPAGGDAATCSFGDDTVYVPGSDDEQDDVDSDSDVIVTDDVEIDIDTSGCVRVESAVSVEGDIDAGGDVEVRSDAKIEGDIDADGDVTIRSDVEMEGDISAGGDVLIQSGATVNGDVDADGSVTVESGATVDGDISGGSSGDDEAWPVSRLVTVTNNQGASLSVTVSLLNPGDGELIVDGNSQGDSVTISILPDGSRDVSIETTESAGSTISFQIDALNTEAQTSVTLERSVPTVEVTPTPSGEDGGDGGDGGGDDEGDDDDDGEEDDDDDDEEDNDGDDDEEEEDD